MRNGTKIKSQRKKKFRKKWVNAFYSWHTDISNEIQFYRILSFLNSHLNFFILFECSKISPYERFEIRILMLRFLLRTCDFVRLYCSSFLFNPVLVQRNKIWTEHWWHPSFSQIPSFSILQQSLPYHSRIRKVEIEFHLKHGIRNVLLNIILALKWPKFWAHILSSGGIVWHKVGNASTSK